jgi:hypothetical protein
VSPAQAESCVRILANYAQSWLARSDFELPMIDQISMIEINLLTIDEHGVCAPDALITLRKGDP